MKSVAIFTWCLQKFSNYGQTLQCYAMQEILTGLGCKCKVIRYRSLNDDEKSINIPAKGKIRDYYELIYRNNHYENQACGKILKFIDFIENNITISEQCYTIPDLKEETDDYEVLLLGSDQLWNPMWTEDAYLFDWADNRHRKITYATGGITRFQGRDALNLAEKIFKEGKYDYISVRENSGKEILTRYLSQDVEVVLDPTLMIERKKWDLICSNISINEQYILCFFIGKYSAHNHVLEYFAKSNNVKKIYIIKSNLLEEIIVNGDKKIIEDVGPTDFISLIKNASYVFTDSFHGVAFSILYNKNFYYMDRAYVDSKLADIDRIVNICNTLGIGNRYVNCKKDLNNISPINYSEVESKLAIEREKSLAYLNNAIYK
ncbi:Polysaccharide pyruvyl transferase [Pseudobutyrivibrio sp. C4]|uniref:polysaccharide pyruvyl transferase family protein n=1 Tax=Pseudobutyrivibrio sp. C4 TaxID=1520803 RepID=UPI0008D029DC|nr:polysaccharide pyruvyl transferase family protein [Pseudobutyrivibrio sp. C4]SET12662.1 Polysaccharide pyruvyl transferase [Pseudobutyrivibrio sp. C4]